MAIGFIRGLTSTVLRNLTSLKHDAKRLQRRPVDVFGKVPGLIMIETQEQTIHDCLIEDVPQRLGMSETLGGFRSLDLRERTLPVAISTEVRCWVNAIMNVLPADGAGELESSGWRAAIEHSIKAKVHGRRNTEKGEDDFHAVPFHPVKDGVTAPTVASHWPSWMQDDHLAFVKTEIARTSPGINEPRRDGHEDCQ